ncbi:phage tail protein [Kordia sp. YSTF-M3]|uniref:Phage tail protein n=1 Tax=Kordia aestuariivivens TaxID=2759037 RepID=A0ABR7QFL4_9FLAO|nr:tail fiber protein [Kordia aestuariivivens]MBC8757364.1 phage tail protein [Kordia aestuariivivens]
MNPFLAEIIMFGGNFAPRGWAFCDGQLLSINANQALFSLLGTTYGGDGRTSFALPDLRGRNPIHPGTGPGLSTIKLGQRGGKEEIGLTVLNLPNHFHNAGTLKGTIMCNEEDGVEDDPAGRNIGVSSSGTPYNNNPNDKVMAANAVGISGNTSAAGGQQPFNSRNPFLGINYIIAMQGTFPSRN